jgi:hypothetical protein
MALASLYLQQLLTLGALGGLAWAAGWLLVPPGARPRLADEVLAAGLGLLVLAHACLALAFAEVLTAPSLLVVWLALAGFGCLRRRGVAAAFVWFRRVLAGAAARWQAGAPTDASATGEAARAGLPGIGWIWLLLAAAAGLTFHLALYPPLAYDETTYHLPFAAAFAELGGLRPLPSLRVPVFPALAESLFAGGLLLADDRLPHLVSLLAAALTLAAAAVAAREAVDSEVAGATAIARQPPLHAAHAATLAGPDPPASPGATLAAVAVVALLAGNPLGVYIATTAYLEPLLGLATLLAVLATVRLGHGAPGVSGASWGAVAGFAAGSAAAIKYTGLAVLAVVGLVVLARAARQRHAHLAIAFLFAAVVTAAPTYGRLLAETGNPLFPFFADWFGSSRWDPGPDPRSAAELWRLRLGLPLLALLERSSVGNMPPIGPLWLVAIPFGLFAAWRLPAWRAGLAIAVSTWAATPPDARYLSAVLPLLALPLAIWSSRAARDHLRVALLTALACTSLAPAYAAFAIWRNGPLPTDEDARRTLLARELPQYTLLTRFLATRPSPDPILGAFERPERLHYFGGMRYLGEVIGPWESSSLLARAEESAALKRELARRGVSFVLMARPLPRGATALDCVVADGTGAVLALPDANRPAVPCSERPNSDGGF